MKINLKNRLMDSSLDKVKGSLKKTETPHYFEVRNIDGERYVHCGSEQDAKALCERYSGFTYEKIYLPHTPKIVNVYSVTMDPDPELAAQNILPENQQQPIKF